MKKSAVEILAIFLMTLMIALVVRVFIMTLQDNDRTDKEQKIVAKCSEYYDRNSYQILSNDIENVFDNGNVSIYKVDFITKKKGIVEHYELYAFCTDSGKVEYITCTAQETILESEVW